MYFGALVFQELEYFDIDMTLKLHDPTKVINHYFSAYLSTSQRTALQSILQKCSVIMLNDEENITIDWWASPTITLEI